MELVVRNDGVVSGSGESGGEAGRRVEPLEETRSDRGGDPQGADGARSEGEDAGRFALYIAGTPFAEADSRKLNAGGALLSKALLAASGASGIELTAAYKRHGDLGAAGFDLLKSKAGEASGLTLSEVADAFAAMAAARTTAVRAALVESLLRRATPLEAKYLLKLMIGDMRIGVKQSLVEEAIAAASSTAVTEVRHAVMLEADLAYACLESWCPECAAFEHNSHDPQRPLVS